jgi:hypothetical protein
MKLLFSEHKADYAHYIFPYAIWGFPEAGETPGDFFNHGFLPSSRDLDRFYLCRQVRIHLPKYQPSSENRRILRKGEGINATLVPRTDFDFSPRRRAFCKAYADQKFGAEVMSDTRLDSLLNGRITSHLLVFTDAPSGAELGLVTLYLEPGKLAYYYYAFYDLKSSRENLGMFMMTSAVEFFAGRGFEFLYLGSCYSQNALYKTQFAGMAFFNGVKWSGNLDELKYLVRRGHQDSHEHLLESEEYRRLFHDGEMQGLLSASKFQAKVWS